jgi:hypothetical protein
MHAAQCRASWLFRENQQTIYNSVAGRDDLASSGTVPVDSGRLATMAPALVDPLGPVPVRGMVCPLVGPLGPVPVTGMVYLQESPVMLVIH